MDAEITLNINGQKKTIKTDPSRPLLEVLREELLLTGTHFGCGEGQCGACGVLLNGTRILSCLTPVSAVAGESIVTIEGLANGQTLHPMQQAFLDEGAFQCGYCTSGMIVAAVSLLKRNASPSTAEIREGMNENLCRCCGYPKIISAVKRAATAMAGAKP